MMMMLLDAVRSRSSVHVRSSRSTVSGASAAAGPRQIRSRDVTTVNDPSFIATRCELSSGSAV
jgi:hypothetical protein